MFLSAYTSTKKTFILCQTIIVHQIVLCALMSFVEIAKENMKMIETKMMIKKATGVKYKPEEFRKLNQCTGCSKALDIPYGTRCELCSKIQFRYCEHCEAVLRGGTHNFYSYDNREIHREGVEFLASKELVREFAFQEELPYLSDYETMCESCKGWETRIKDICYWCDNDFKNSRANYKSVGNMCESCVKIYGINL